DESDLDADMTDVIDTRAATRGADRRPAAHPAEPIGPLGLDPAPADRHPGRESPRRLRRAARRPALDLGQGTGRAAAIGAAVT
ncbi:hypothetical protein PAK11_09350, partial [Campylobacter jejuni]|nr:hypothetical protein [Campylobacter jejuni]